MRKYFYLFTICMLIGLANLSAKAGNIPVADSIPAQSIWSKIDLTGKRFKEVFGAPIPRQMRTWPYIVIGGAVVGGGVYLLTNDKDDSPPPLPVANDDQAGLPCGTASTTINVLANDTGEGLFVSSVTQPTGPTVSIASGGNLLISNVGSTGFSFVYTITDQLGRSESATVTINVSDTQPPTISCPPTATVPCGSSTDPSVTGSPTVSDNCTPTPQIMVAFSDQ
ncbi:MAG: Ig-like domain-containing protein, partial [Saprospiraceae bacterium]|nr:Ig-like domain-containing protein [Saprospiraceae bacterium]